MTISDCIKILDEGKTLTKKQAHGVISDMMSDSTSEEDMISFLTKLSVDKLTPEVIAGAADAMREKAMSCVADNIIDVVGTGGDGIDTFNVSTAASIVVAAAGGRVLKHGNRSNSSKCGSADLLEAFGARLDVDGEQAVKVLEESGFCFLFAQKFHPSMKHVGPVRRKIKERTIFNVLGPLTNPAYPKHSLTGVFSKPLAEIYAKTFLELNVKKAMVVISHEGLDEISPSGPTHAWFIEDGKVEQKDITPSDFGLPTFPLDKVAGGEPKENVNTFKELLDGKEGPVMDFVLLNAGAALFVAGLAKDLKEGADKAREAIKDGRAKKVMDNYVKWSTKLKKEQEETAPPPEKKQKNEENGESKSS